jgi:hypothetical protein
MGLSGLGAALEAMSNAGIVMKYDAIHQVLGMGNFVLVSSEGSLGGKPTSFYDLFRLADGKIAEHWDTIEQFRLGPTGRTRTASSRPASSISGPSPVPATAFCSLPAPDVQRVPSPQSCRRAADQFELLVNLRTAAALRSG